MSIRSLLYRIASLLGDINAVRKGPDAVAKRIVRKAIYKRIGRAMR